MKNYWEPWFLELSKKISEGGEAYLIEKAKSVNWGGTQDPALLSHGDENIDPFSFLYFLACKNTRNQFEPVFSSVHEVFNINARSPAELNQTLTIPTPTEAFQVLFHDGDNFNPGLLWSLFRQTVQGDIASNDFEQVLEIRQVGIFMLTQTMFLINPNEYIPIDDNVRKVLGHLLSDSSKADLKVGNKYLRNDNINYESAMRITSEIKDFFPNCENYEINEFLYLQNNSEYGLISEKSRFFHVSTQAYGNNEGDFWENTLDDDVDIQDEYFKENSWVFTGGDHGGTRKYPVQDPQLGDVIFVRTGITQGRAVGVVRNNQYRDGWTDDRRIHVIWINKTTGTLAGYARQIGFGIASPDTSTYQAFANCAEYRSTFKLIQTLQKKSNDLSEFIDPVDVDQPSDMPRTEHPLNTILYGPPGTGKTYSTTRRCVEICNGTSERSEDEIREEFKSLIEKKRVRFVTFHQSYSYEEFVEGLRPTTNESGAGFTLIAECGILKSIAKCARENENVNYVLIIDEINRANISKVLGELITLLEDDKREGKENQVKLQLPYSRKEFTLPANLYILGTMNTADRSIALLDSALRRRFEFEEMMPDPSLLNDASEATEVNLAEVLRAINERIEYLKDRDHLIGHAWLMKAKDRESLDNIMRNKIIPLIAEYFHEDWQNVRAILGGTNDFVTCEKLSVPPGMEAAYDDRYSWKINEQFPVVAYENLISGKNTNSE